MKIQTCYRWFDESFKATISIRTHYDSINLKQALDGIRHSIKTSNGTPLYLWMQSSYDTLTLSFDPLTYAECLEINAIFEDAETKDYSDVRNLRVMLFKTINNVTFTSIVYVNERQLLDILNLCNTAIVTASSYEDDNRDYTISINTDPHDNFEEIAEILYKR